jgi:hypothetical protein
MHNLTTEKNEAIVGDESDQVSETSVEEVEEVEERFDDEMKSTTIESLPTLYTNIDGEVEGLDGGKWSDIHLLAHLK